MKKWMALTAAAMLLGGSLGQPAHAAPASEADAKEAGAPEQRRAAYGQLSLMTGLDWEQIAALDQYERTLRKARPKARPKLGSWAGLYASPEQWSGATNPDPSDRNPDSIRFFGGIGRDGDGDGKADPSSDIDLLYAQASAVARFGGTADDFSIGVWEFYHNQRAVQRVNQFTLLYRTFGRLDLDGSAFPVPVGTDYSYRSTWGTARGWGGHRTHEGTDIFAGHGLPVRSTCYGVIENMGWNAYGGWRIGIRDLDNRYHYYAHLSGFDKSLRSGMTVEPGRTLGWVGSSGYGKPGTSGKFPPHLHYGIYRDRGMIEWAFDPYPLLRQWEKAEAKAKKARRGR
ncbi:Cell wall endopeptidase, family M23/M37 [Paenibacillus pasadenensis]|uniref:Cell wall endopeptidase, family M23/M37 n=1 Tax=Paenibacillus pasadenensis TaxID=217090 RepID=A0A2N5N3Q8_9BACL|nr:M23 family metallopeptidase [Paenibacillus pasadenensis]PLT44950.1 Cell wall endopeptidase, family M23/M37 [Paenibacillus pasadenensis]